MGRPLRKSVYVVPPEESSSEAAGESDTDEHIPLARFAKKYKKERDDWSSEEDDIPLMEITKNV